MKWIGVGFALVGLARLALGAFSWKRTGERPTLYWAFAASYLGIGGLYLR